jgi:DNA polymerase family B
MGNRPFMGVDGEGGGRNRHGQQHYLLLRAGPHELLAKSRRRLTTYDCLDFLCGLPRDPILVGFSFGYDTTQILRDLTPERLQRLFLPKPADASHYTWLTLPNPRGSGVKRFGVEYLPKNYLRVCRMGEDWRPVKDSARTVYETFGFFQMSFLRALQAFGIGRQHWERIEANKAGRENFRRMTDEIRFYNQLECELLADLMEEFREMCFAADLRPGTWNGAGKLAAAEHKKHHTITAIQVRLRTPEGVLQMASDAYYGGRFEVPYVGDVPGPIYEYDLRSAYPSAMRSLPCLQHGRWHTFTGRPPPRSLHVAYVAFTHRKGARLCGLPVRQRDGRLFWPRQGQGTYWSVELSAARRLGARIRYTAGWYYERRCTCQPYDWVEHRYEQRRALGSAGRGYPIKLGLNSLYGKLAQRVGNPRYGNLVHAGLITAATRAALINAARQSPDSIVMFATDALFSRTPLALPIGEGLGQWEAAEHPRLFVCQPGLYWGAKKPKTRGVPASFFAEHTTRFEQAWRAWCMVTPPEAPSPPSLAIPVPSFVGLRLAHARGKPETAGKWIKTTDPAALRTFSFDWTGKRAAVPEWITPTCVHTHACTGAPDLVSLPHRDTPAKDFDIERMELEDCADPPDLRPPL